MGKGDIKTKRGKITSGTFGKRRPHKQASPAREGAEEKKEDKKSV